MEAALSAVGEPRPVVTDNAAGANTLGTATDNQEGTQDGSIAEPPVAAPKRGRRRSQPSTPATTPPSTATHSNNQPINDHPRTTAHTTNQPINIPLRAQGAASSLTADGQCGCNRCSVAESTRVVADGRTLITVPRPKATASCERNSVLGTGAAEGLQGTAGASEDCSAADSRAEQASSSGSSKSVTGRDATDTGQPAPVKRRRKLGVRTRAGSSMAAALFGGEPNGTTPEPDTFEAATSATSPAFSPSGRTDTLLLSQGTQLSGPSEVVLEGDATGGSGGGMLALSGPASDGDTKAASMLKAAVKRSQRLASASRRDGRATGVEASHLPAAEAGQPQTAETRQQARAAAGTTPAAAVGTQTALTAAATTPAPASIQTTATATHPATAIAATQAASPTAAALSCHTASAQKATDAATGTAVKLPRTKRMKGTASVTAADAATAGIAESFTAATAGQAALGTAARTAAPAVSVAAPAPPPPPSPPITAGTAGHAALGAAATAATAVTAASTAAASASVQRQRSTAPIYSGAVECKGRVSPVGRFANSTTTMLQRLAQAVAATRCMDVKEVMESVEFVERVRKRVRRPCMLDLAAGHGLVGMLLAAVEPTVEHVIIFDHAKPKSHAIARKAVASLAPWTLPKLTYFEYDLNDLAEDLGIPAPPYPVPPKEADTRPQAQCQTTARLAGTSAANVAVLQRLPPRLQTQQSKEHAVLEIHTLEQAVGAVQGYAGRNGMGVVAVHACGDLTDTCIGIAVRLRAPVAVMPCCYTGTAKSVPLGVKRALGVAMASDVNRSYVLSSAGIYSSVDFSSIPDTITPANRIIVAQSSIRASGKVEPWVTMYKQV